MFVLPILEGLFCGKEIERFTLVQCYKISSVYARVKTEGMNILGAGRTSTLRDK